VSWADSFLIVLTLLSGINVWALISLRRRTTKTEIEIAVLHVRLRDLRRDQNTLWVSANHQLPKGLEIKR
jgi:hypothetical protein